MYIDTSCLVAYYLPEPMSEDVQQKIQTSERVFISLITDIEILSVIRKKERIGDINSKDADNVFQLYKSHRNNGLYQVAELSQSVFKASEFILQSATTIIRTLDSIHLGLVYENKLNLFTFDRVLLDTAMEFNIKTIRVE